MPDRGKKIEILMLVYKIFFPNKFRPWEQMIPSVRPTKHCHWYTLGTVGATHLMRVTLTSCIVRNAYVFALQYGSIDTHLYNIYNIHYIYTGL